MPAPTEIEDVVVPLQLQPVVDRPRGWRGRSGGLVAIALAGFLVTALILGRAADPGPAQPAIAALGSAPATAVPSVTIPRATPSPEPVATPVATPLPAREVIGGRIPDERRIVYANGVQVLDLATGTLEPTTRPLYDRMLPVADDQVVCACTLGGIEGGDATVPASIRFGRYDLAGRPIVERDVLSLRDVVAAPDVTSGFNLTSTLSADRRTLYVLIATRRPPSWSIDVYEVRVRDGRTLGHALLGRLPTDPATSATASPSPSDSAGTPTGEMPDGIYVWVNGLAAAPGGRTLHAVIGYVDLRKGVWNNYDREWMVPLHGGHPGKPIQIRTDGQPNDDWCVSVPQFVDDDLLVEACAAGPVETVDTTYQLRRFASDGTRLEDLPVEGFSTSLRYPVVTALDRGARAMYLWDPVRHLIGRIDVDTGAASTSAAQVSLPPDVSADSLGMGVDPGLVVSPDGSRLYALGMLANGSPAGRSTGIWVFDARTLQPLDHWPARARLTSLAVSADGTFVYAAGAQGFDADGNAGASGASVTVYDATTGEIQVIYGSVSPDGWLNFPTWP